MHYHVRCLDMYDENMVDHFIVTDSATPFKVFIVKASTTTAAVVNPFPSATIFFSISRSCRWVTANLFGSLFVVRFTQHALYKAVVPIV